MADIGGVTIISPLILGALSRATLIADGFRSVNLKEGLVKLVDLLNAIKDVAEGAEVTQESYPSIRLWLQKLSNAVYDAIDKLDEVDYYVLEKVAGIPKEQVQASSSSKPDGSRRGKEVEIPSQKRQKLEQVVDHDFPSQKPQEQVHSFSSYYNLIADFDKEEKYFIDEFSRINASLAGISEELGFIKKMIQFRKKHHATATPSYEIFQLLDKSKIIGREHDVSKIVKLLGKLRSQNPISGISLVGMAGVGKTTVARLIYEKATEEKLYDVVAWVSASEGFDDERILREMLEYCDDFGDILAKGEGRRTDELLQCLSKGLAKKTFLLILDDLWDLDSYKWHVFAGHLSKVVDLPDERCSIVLTTQSKSVASVTAEEKLFSMHKHEMRLLSDDASWSIIKKTVLRSPFKASIQSDLEVIGKEIARWCGGLPLAAVSIGETLCCQMGLDEWMSIKENGSWLANSEDGNKILSVLKSRSFDRLSSPLKKCFSYCSLLPKGSVIVKDDLVQLWMAQGFLQRPSGSSMTVEDVGNEYFSDLLSDYFFQNEVRDSCGNIISCEVHGIMHDLALFVSKGETLIRDETRSFDGGADIRHLRVVGFLPWHVRIPREVIPRVRSLFSESNCISYPVVSGLRSLRCLTLRGYYDTFVPLDLDNMKYLKYLSISNGSFEMPESFSMARSLETLKLSHCHKLTTLRIGLSIKNLKISHSYDLTSIQSMGELASLQSFELNSCCELISVPIELDSCISLKNLRINYCWKLTSIPTMRGLSSLENLDINGCERWTLTSLPISLGSCISLKNLKISHSTGVVSLPSIHGLSTCVSLESLELARCDELESLLSEQSSSLSLQKLTIRNCPRIQHIPKVMTKFPSLVCLEIYDCRRLRSIPEEWLGSLTTLTKLTLGRFSQELEELPGFTSIHHLKASLKILKMDGWPKLKSLPQQLEHLTALEELEMGRFNRVKFFPEWLGNLTSLRSLKIERCKKFEQLPSQEAMLRLSNLQHLQVLHCPKFKRRYMEESCPEKSKVFHIAEMVVR